ncbi:hypothetical protein AcetOrient_orf03978 [Acetobacter orientalis]|uniref:Uncharacterized protein n=1 Tax=Acetobacter orientalis TaxID=146474 RepID=A0A2Z5ZKL6_9PROT|nr:hypothetical protein AcetOrient_orf03978 [Acetobacter orientalis]
MIHVKLIETVTVVWVSDHAFVILDFAQIVITKCYFKFKFNYFAGYYAHVV